ncbi:insulinase family protein [Modestobacter sp. I12A-02628]|uniref:Insulinase family protein n=1 Tax=Goekera deserti TaxID=2497753 RepID=A0A7K3WIT9_9ACTN|nr:pitrilysin family protein [Goekera deserti]MPQ97219.1 insulinase family protein [Goekera deserti]NDI50271.1 insulinase family protein [Goekera deserti]NEL55839.1 insulinase family protein [Goekera deserti]
MTTAENRSPSGPRTGAGAQAPAPAPLRGGDADGAVPLGGGAVGLTQVLDVDEFGGRVERTELPGGLRVITETMPGVLSATLGIWVGVGSRDETPGVGGSSHFLEHLLFKGTGSRTALEIATAMDAVGGEMNAFTAKEHTCYYANVLASDLPLAVTLLGDLVTDALNTAADLDSERTVVLEEIAMRDDEPSDAVHDLFAETLFGDTSLGRSVLGTVETIEALTRDDVDGWYRSRYRVPSIVVSAAGRVGHQQVLDLVAAAFGDRIGGAGRPEPVREGTDVVLDAPARSTGLIHRRTEQVHLLLGSVGMGRLDDRRYAAAVLDTAVGGGMSSRLFQEVREKRGLVYSVGSSLTHYAGTGSFSVYAGCSPKRVSEVLRLVRAELSAVAADGLTPEEVSRAIGQLKGGLVLGLEDTGSRMSRLGKSELSYGEYVPVPGVLARLDDVDVEQVRAVAADLLTRDTCLAVVGPYREKDLDRL